MNDWCDVSVASNRETFEIKDYLFSTAYGSRFEYNSTYCFMDFVIGTNTLVEI
jgi:hypothetical protein